MFDPTAFDNMKVVLDGAAYDLELSGEAIIKGRRDIVDLAVMSRSFSIKMALAEYSNASAEIRIDSTLEHLAAELLPNITASAQGSIVTLEFSWRSDQSEASLYSHTIKQLWGPDRGYEEVEMFSSLQGARKLLIVSFNRKFTEEMMDDLLEVLHHVVKTLQRLG